jgi:DNA-binding NarL/FixJ family response regulator
VASVENDITTPVADPRQTLQSTIRIMVADDHAIARTALSQILALAEDFDVVGEAVDGADAVEKARVLRPDVILMDANMPNMDGLEATRLISSQFPGIKIIGHSVHTIENMQPQMVAAGAACYLRKPTGGAELFATIRGVMKARRAGEH